MKTKQITIDDICNVPDGTFKKFIENKNKILEAIELHRIAKIKAVRNNQPVPELGFDVELCMLA